MAIIFLPATLSVIVLERDKPWISIWNSFNSTTGVYNYV